MENQLAHPGPCCARLNLKVEDLKSGIFCEIQETLTNGAVLEIKKLVESLPNSYPKVHDLLSALQPHLRNYNDGTIRSNLARIQDMYRKLLRKKKVSMFKNVQDLLNAKFMSRCKQQESVTESQPQPSTVENPISTADSESEQKSSCTGNKEEMHMKSVLDDTEKQTDEHESTPKFVTSETQTSPNEKKKQSCGRHCVHEHTKQHNTLRYEIVRQQKALIKLRKLVDCEKATLDNLSKAKGHFSVRNVTKRDEIAYKNRRSLRETKGENRKLRLQLNSQESKTTDLSQQMSEIKNENENLKTVIATQEKGEKVKKRSQNKVHYYKKKLKTIRASTHCNQSVTDILKKEIHRKDALIDTLTSENEQFKEKLSETTYCQTKNSDGSYCDNLRLCIIELFGLEIAVEKIPRALAVVAKNLFCCDIKKSDLPNSTSVQRIVDEGHYLAKAFIASELDDAESWGLNRDGTTRKKQKIVDTSVTLDTGEILSLGFTTVAHETAAVITEVTKYHMKELATINTANESDVISEEYLLKTLQKLAFTMSDRASNEKLADKMLASWREEVLSKCENEQERKTVKHFHCMAHVLLGFHRYLCDDLKQEEKKMTDSEGQIGRDALPVFKTWSKRGTVVERVVRTTADIFGPVGDHHGVRDRWEAFCADKHIKSLIGNYRDNRFNCLFETAAEICVHYTDFLTVLKTMTKNKNLKLKSVQADLESKTVKTMLNCMAHLYLKVTGPFWMLITSNSVSYLELYPYVQKLEQYLQICTSDPKILVEQEQTWMANQNVEPVAHCRLMNDALSKEETTDLLLKLVSLSCGAFLRTVRKQLVDFLEDGQFSVAPNKEDLVRTGYAHLTNLGCEHHFGDLDSSQRRRPNASMHHHSSVQIIKRNGQKMISWLADMPKDVQSSMLKLARKGGKELRKRHRSQEQQVKKDIVDEMEKESNQPAKKRKISKVKAAECDDDDLDEYNEEELLQLLPQIDNFAENSYIVVAYQDAWYPGCVVSVTENKRAILNFMTPCRKAGTYMWPSRKDIQEIDKQFVLKCNLIPECCNSGRQWYFAEYKELDKLYAMYKDHFF